MRRRSRKATPAKAQMMPAPARKRPARIVLADDHGIVTEGLRLLLEPEYDVVATVRDGQAMLEAACALRPDVVIADISMPVLNGVDAIRQLARQAPRVRAICLTMHADRTYVAEALEAGARGFVLKHSAPDEIRDALRAVLAGGTYVTPSLGGADATRRPGGRRAERRVLTTRQRQILRLVAEGQKVKQIACALGVAPKTVEFHKYRMMARLGLQSIAQLVQYAIRHSVVPP